MMEEGLRDGVCRHDGRRLEMQAREEGWGQAGMEA
jgi:hypothetical protein